ncbi:MAG: glycosyltransferase [Phycisphaerae bacterium]
MSNSTARPDGPAALRLAVVICTRDRPAALVETLRSVWTQSRRPDELIVIDDGCLSEEIRSDLAAACRRHGIRWRYERTDAPGLTRGRNLAARLAESDVLLYLDDDVTCDTACVAEIADLMGDPSVAGVTATICEPAFESRRARLYQLGYRLAGWWSVRPRRRPTGPRPAALRRPDVAVPARWLSGAAMALRRAVVLAHPFDESLAGYGLGEDREMTYRLAPWHWLIESRRARVVHRRDAAGRSAPRRSGFMTSLNYLRILRKTCDPGAGEWLLIGWSLFVLAAMQGVAALVGRRGAHLAELRGMVEGGLAFLTTRDPRTDRPAAHRIDRRPSPPTISEPALPVAGHPLRRVLFVTNRLDCGGAEQMLVSLVAHLPRFEVRPFILCLKEAGPLAGACRAAGVRVFANTLNFKTDAAVILRMQRIVVDERIDVIVAAHSGGDRTFWSALTGRVCDVPVVVWSHWFPRVGERHFERANRALYRWIDTFVALGARHRAALIRHEHVPAGRIVVIPNGIDLARYPGPPQRTAARRRLGLEDRRVAVALVANLRREKRHDVFIQAAAALASHQPDLRFLIIGEGAECDAVADAAAASGLDRDTLRLLGPRDDVPELLPGVDIACLCSEVECFPMTMLEAAASGCAFIGPDVGGVGEFVDHGRTGLIIQPADAVSLADAIGTLAGDAGLRGRLAAAARQTVLRGYDIDATARRFAELFLALPPRRGGKLPAARARAGDRERPIERANAP